MSSPDPETLRVVFFGTADFAVPALERLTAGPGVEVLSVVTQPDRPKGRGHKTAAPPVKTAAERLGLPVLQPTRLRSGRLAEALGLMAPDFFVVAAYGRILPREMLRIPRVAPVNIHGSLLPRYRGAAPIQRALMDGCVETGVTTMVMTEELDAGDILQTATYRIRDDDDAGSVTSALADMGAALILETLQRMAAGQQPRTPQDHAQATYAPPITQDDCILRWGEPAERVCHRIRAMSPRPGATTEHAGRRLKVLRARPVPSETAAAPGEIIAVTRDGVLVQAGCGAVGLETVHPEGRRPMPAADWARGARVVPGTRFATIPSP